MDELSSISQEQAARNQLIQNLLVVTGIVTAAEMSSFGRKVVMDALMQLMAYLSSPTDEKVIENVTPLYPLYG